MLCKNFFNNFLVKIAIACLIFVSLNGCYIDLTVEEFNNTSDVQACILMGKVIDDKSEPAPVLIVAYSIEYSTKEQSQIIRIADSIFLSEAGPYTLYVTEGNYYVAVYKDFNKDTVFTKKDFAGIYGDSDTITVSKQLRTGIDINISSRPENKFNFPISIEPAEYGENKKYGLEGRNIAALSDERFSQKYSSMGMWSPTVFNNKIGANIYLLEKYDKTKIPILYIHGAGGSPRDFKPIVNNIDTNIYQAWFFHYPSGMKLEKTSETLYKKLNNLYSRYRFQTLYITAHSMGGLVARSFIKKYNQDNRFNYLKGYISLATPYGGNEASRLGFEYSPVQVPCWEDVATNSQFLKDLYSTKMPEQIQFYLFFGYAGNNRIYKDPNDGAISLKSQLDPKIKKEATLTLGIDADHVSILYSKEMLKKYTEVLTTLKQKTDVLKNNFDYNFETDLTYRLQMELNPIMCITPDGFKGSQYKFDDIENATPGGSVKLYKDMLESGNSLKIIKAARIICRSFIGNIILSETASRVLLKDFTKNIEDKLHSKAMAWLCNVLGLSKDIRYRLTLEKVLLESKNSKLKYYVEKNLSKLDEINIPSVDRFAMCTKGNCINGQGSMIFPDGIEYSGGFNRKTRNKYGVLTIPDKRSYSGEWLNNKMYGQGKMTYQDGAYYEGQVKNNMRHGNGTMFFPGGIKYTGQFANDMRNGAGMRIFKDGATSTGIWKNNNHVGREKISTKKTAPAKTKNKNMFPIISEHKKTWGNDLLIGQPGECISGNCVNGNGIKKYNNGMKYTGFFKDSMRNGYGEGDYQNSTKYVGNWSNDLRHGRGTMFYKDNTKYIGTFKSNKKHGLGIVIFPDGKEFSGKFHSGARHGKGVGVLSDGTKYKSSWRKGKIVGNKLATESLPKTTPEKRAFPDGKLYINSFKSILSGKKYYFEFLMYCGNLNFQNNDFKKAVFCYQNALKVLPGNAKALVNRGTSFMKQGFLKKAINDFNEAISIEPNNAKAFCNRGTALHKSAQNKLALADFDKAIEINPLNKEALNNRGCLWIDLGDMDKAINDFNKVIKIHKKADIGYYNRGVTWLKKGKEKKGFADLKKVLVLNPTDKRYEKIKLFFKI